jgi:thioredoxin:protein disulfide reductase
MEETVFNQPAVKKRLEDFIVVRYAAEQPNESPAREVLDHFGVIGLPSYVVVTLK